MSSGVPCGDDLAAVLAGARPHVDDVVGGEDRVVVVLDDDHAVAEVAQVLQRRRAAGRCRAGAGRSTARRARTSRRSGPSRSATRAGCAAPRRRTASRRSGRATGSRARRCSGTAAGSTISLMILSAIAWRWPSSFRPAKNSTGLLQRPAAHFVDRALVAGWPTLTCRASRRSRVPSHSGQGLEFRYLASSSRTIDRIGFAIAALQVRDDPFERMLAHHRLAAIGEILERDLLLVAAVEDHLLDALGQLRRTVARGRTRNASPGSAASESRTGCGGPSP